ncbi:MAG: type II toxin-antitoxin system VapC family toxin [Rhodoferax sp.]|jgi:predicted nucleic-acid-binding protein|uniref:PIN domain-containing protein n=1 Tax=Rhodoferax sp. TaxID=50421 RepID=UPI003BB1DE90
MIGLDTNVLVRYLTQDDARQAAIATRLIEQELSPTQPGFISLVVLVEVCWVLQRLYAATQDELLHTVKDLLDTARFSVEQRQVVQEATRQMLRQRVKVGFTDVLIVAIAKAKGCSQTVSFDKVAVRSAGMTLLV